VVWTAPVQAKVICELQGKRLCAQEELTNACNGDPDGGKPRKFAYGDEMDLSICNTDKPAATFGPGCVRRTCSRNFSDARRCHLPESELRRIRRKVTMVFQSGALFDSLTVAENVLFPLELREDYNARNRDDVVNGLLEMVDIAHSRDAYPADLSTGYKRAVAIARALAAQPQCVLYDEPTTMVDPIMSGHLGDLLLRLKKPLQLTSVVVTHDLELMRNVADRVVVLFEGRAIYFGPVADLEKSNHPHIQEFLAMDRV
jgi:ABC-type transporter Mla maintaining outer membrane lipid asymmetry ATPase subunit MlaF